MRIMKNLAGRVLGAAALVALLGASSMTADVPAIDAGASPPEPTLTPGVYCEVERGGEPFSFLPGCTRTWIEGGVLYVPPAEFPDDQPGVQEQGALHALGDGVALVQVGPLLSNGRDGYIYAVFVLAPNGIAITPFPALDAEDQAAAAARGVTLRPGYPPSGVAVADGAPEDIRAWIGDVVRAKFAPARDDADTLAALVDEAVIILRVAASDTPNDRASDDEIRANYDETRAALERAILASGSSK